MVKFKFTGVIYRIKINKICIGSYYMFLSSNMVNPKVENMAPISKLQLRTIDHAYKYFGGDT